MKAIMKNGEIKEIDTTKTIFDNQYITTDGTRIFDSEIKKIIDDIRLGEFYCGFTKQGTYDEVAQAIANERAKIYHCEDCFWYQIDHRVEELCSKNEVKEDNRVTIRETIVYEYACAYKDTYKKCVHDIDEKPKLFREVQNCFFCEHPEGVPDMTDFNHFLIDNSKRFEIVSVWSDETLNYDSSFECKKNFGSYHFRSYFGAFELSNARNTFKFIINFKDKTFILVDRLGYKEVKRFTESTWKNNKSVNLPIKNWDKFTNWIFPIIDEYYKSKEVK